MTRVSIILFFVFNTLIIYSAFGAKPNTQLDVELISFNKINNNVNTIFKDSRGFMWLGTEGGLYRYDGYDYKKYTYEGKDSTETLSDNVFAIAEDDSYNLWIGTRSGLNILNLKQEKTVHIPLNWVTDVCPSNYGGFWIATREGLLRTCQTDELEEWAQKQNLPVKSINGHKFIYYLKEVNTENTLNDNQIKCLLEDSKGNLWVGTDNFGADWGAVHLLQKDETDNYPPSFKMYKWANDGSKNQMCKWPEEFYEDTDGNMWIVSWLDGLIQLNPNTDEIRQHHFTKNWNGEHEHIMAIEADEIGNLYLASYGNGLLRIKAEELGKENPRFEFVQYNQGGETIIESYSMALYCDEAGTLWIGTRGKGVLKTVNTFELERLLDPKNREATEQRVVKIVEIDGVFYFAKEYGRFSTFNPNTEEWKHYALDYNFRVYSFYKINDKEILVGTEKGLFRFNTSSNEHDFYFKNMGLKDSIVGGSVGAIFKTNDGGLAFMFMENLGMGILKNEKLSLYDIEDNYLNGMVKLSDGNYLFCKKWYNPCITNTSFEVINQLQLNLVYEHNITHSAVEDEFGNLWLATLGGVYKMNKEGELLERLDEDKGLTNNIECFITCDDKGFLWLSSLGGISRIDPGSNEIVNFDYSKGIGNVGFIEGAGLLSSSGNIYLGTDKGVVYFNPNNIEFNTQVPPVYITSFSVHNKTLAPGDAIGEKYELDQSITFTEHITLDYQSNVLGFEFSALNYIAPEKNRFAYKMEGVDNDWITVSPERRFASYAGLQHGDYIFSVKAANNDGTWNNEGVSVRITINPPWWLTWWFKTVVLFVILGIILLVFHLRLRSLNKTKQTLRKMVNQKTAELKNKNEKLVDLNSKKDQFLRIMAHDLKNPIGNTKVFTELIVEKYDGLDKDAIKEYLVAVDKQMHDTYSLLENLLIWERKALHGNQKMELKPINLNTIVRRNIDLYSSNQKSVAFINNCPQDVSVIADVDMLHFVLRNLLGNALKFSFTEGKVHVNLNSVNGKKCIEIIDEGTGMEQEQIDQFNNAHELDSLIGTKGEKGTGLGLLNCREFVIRMNGTIDISSAENKGTTVQIFLPFENES